MVHTLHCNLRYYADVASILQKLKAGVYPYILIVHVHKSGIHTSHNFIQAQSTGSGNVYGKYLVQDQPSQYITLNDRTLP